MASGTNIGSLFWNLGLNTAPLQRDSKKASTALSGLFNPAVLGATALAGAILKAGDAALSFSRDFETAFAEVQTISQTARDNADDMKDSLLELTTRIPIQAVDATKALYQIVSAGFDGADAMNVLEASAKAAVAGVSTTAVAADTLTTIINAYGLSASEVTDVSDALFKTVELGKTTLSELGSSFSQVAGLGAAYNIELNDILAATAQLTSQGASTSEAITRIRGAIVALSKEFGPAVFEGRNLAEAFQFARDEADKAGEGYEEFFGRVEAVVGILGLTGDQLDIYRDKLGKVNEASGSTELAFGIINTTLEAQETLLKNNINVLLGQFGDVLNDIKKEVLPGLNAELEVLTDKSIPAYAKALSALGNAVNVGLLFGGAPFSAEQFSPEIVKFQKEAERQVKKFNDLTKNLSDEAFQNEVENIRAQQKENSEAFQALQDRKEKGYQFDEDALKEARQNNLTFYKILEEAEKRLAKIREEAPPPASGGGETPQAKPRTYQDILDDISAAEKAVKTSTKSQIKDATDRLKELEKERDAWLDIANAVEVATETVKAFKQIKTGDVTAFIDPKVPDLAAKNTDKLGLEVDKLDKKIKDNTKSAEKWQKELDTEEANKKLMSILYTTNDIVDSVRSLTSEYSKQLGLTEDQSKVLDDGFNAISGVLDIASGDIVGGVTKIADSIISQVIPSTEKLNESFERTRDKVLSVVDAIGIAYETLSSFSSDASLIALSRIGSEIEAITAEAKRLSKELPGSNESYGPRRGDVAGSGVAFRSIGLYITQLNELESEIERLSEKLLTGNISEAQRKAIEALIDSYAATVSQIDAITTDVIGTSITDLSESLAEAFFNGETAAESWGRTVDDIIKNVIIRQLSASLLSDQITAAVNKLITDTAGGLTPDEAEAFQNEVERIAATTAPAFEAARKALEDIGFDFTGTDNTDTGLAGAIKREITEETAGLMLGRMVAIQVDIKEIQELNINQNEILLESSGYLQNIELNTRNNALLPDILDELQTMNVNLKNNL